MYEQDGGYTQPDHEAKFSHELVSGAASFEAMKLFEDHQRKEGKHDQRFPTTPFRSKADNPCRHTGKQVDHQFAKELLAGFAGGEIDKLAETHGAGSNP